MSNNKKKKPMPKGNSRVKARELAEAKAKFQKRALTVCISALLIIATLISVLVLTSKKHKGHYYVEMTVEDYGTVILELDCDAAPKTVKNFVKLVRRGFYDGLTFHRVMSGFMIQGGDPEGTGAGGSKKKIVGEFSANGRYNPIKHERGVISMARSNDMNSASSQFFICNATNSSVSSLDGSYAAFGRVISGMDVVDAITQNTAPYGNSNGVISNTSVRAVISEMKLISYKDAQ